jgi:hypothetical protein
MGAIVLFNGVADASELAMELGKIARDAVKEAARRFEVPRPAPEEFRPLLGLYLAQESGSSSGSEWRDGKLTVVDDSNDKVAPDPHADPEPRRVADRAQRPRVRRARGLPPTPRRPRGLPPAPTSASTPSSCRPISFGRMASYADRMLQGG